MKIVSQNGAGSPAPMPLLSGKFALFFGCAVCFSALLLAALSWNARVSASPRSRNAASVNGPVHRCRGTEGPGAALKADSKQAAPAQAIWGSAGNTSKDTAALSVSHK